MVDHLIGVRVEERILLGGVERSFQLCDERIQRRDDAGVCHRVHPQSVGVLNACGRVVEPAAVGEQRPQPGGHGVDAGGGRGPGRGG